MIKEIILGIIIYLTILLLSFMVYYVFEPYYCMLLIYDVLEVINYHIRFIHSSITHKIDYHKEVLPLRIKIMKNYCIIAVCNCKILYHKLVIVYCNFMISYYRFRRDLCIKKLKLIKQINNYVKDHTDREN